MQPEELTNVPKILLSSRDLALLAKILRSYLRCLQQGGKLAMPGIQTRRIMEIRQRIESAALVYQDGTTICLPLQLDEIKALRKGIRGFIHYVSRRIPPAQERAESLTELERLCTELTAMIASSVN